MSELSPVPKQWLGIMPNLDFISEYHLELSESEVSWNALNRLVLLSRKAAIATNNAYSHRGFVVGGAGFAMDPSSQRFGIFTGFNFKPEANGDINIHAEQVVLEKIRAHGFDRMDALVVWGDPQPDQQSGRMTGALCPCGLCRQMLQEAPEVNDNMPILGATKAFDHCELYDLARLVSFHEGGIDVLPTVHPFTLGDRAIEQPAYDGALGFWLLDAWQQMNPDAPYARVLAGWFAQTANG